MDYRRLSGRSLSGRHVSGRALGVRVSGGSASANLPGPIDLEWDGDTADSRPDFDVIYYSGAGAPTDLAVGDVIRLQVSATGAGVWTTYLTHTVISNDLVFGVEIDVSVVTPLANATYDFRGRVERGLRISQWGATEQATVNAVQVLPYFTVLFN